MAAHGDLVQAPPARQTIVVAAPPVIVQPASYVVTAAPYVVQPAYPLPPGR